MGLSAITPVFTTAPTSAADAVAQGGFVGDGTVNAIDTVPDVNTPGDVFLSSLENSALTDLTVLGTSATAAAVNGALPYNPANPLFGGLPRGTTTAVPSSGGNSGMLILLILLFFFLK